MIDNQLNRVNSDRRNSSKIRYIVAIIVLAVVVGFAVIAYLPELRERIPLKDPYNLVSLDQRQQDEYSKLAGINVGTDTYVALAELAFLNGEIFESEYFLKKAGSNNSKTSELNSRLNKYRNLKKQLERSLYNDRKFFNTPFIYTDDYKIIDEILGISDTGYIRVRHLFLKGYLLLREGRRTEARRIFDDLRKNGGRLAGTSQYFYAKSFIQDDDAGNGIDAFNEYINRNSSERLTPLAYYHMSNLHRKAGDFQKALETSEKGIEMEVDTDYIPDLYLAKEAALREIDHQKADATLRELFNKYPSNSFVFTKALEIYDENSENTIPPEKRGLFLELANVLIENGRYTQSKDLLGKINPDDAFQKSYAGFLEAKRLNGSGETNAAIRKCKSIVEDMEDVNLKSRTYLLLGELYGTQKNVSSAEKYYKLSGDSHGEGGDYALREIARIAYENGWRIKAENYYSDLVNKFSESDYVSEALNYLVVLYFYKNDDDACERYARMLSEKGTYYEDRLKGNYFLYRLGKGSKSYSDDYPLCYYSFIINESPVQLHLGASDAYPNVNKYKNNLAWDYFLAGCYDLAEKEYQHQDNHQDPYAKMVSCYLGFFHKAPHDGIRMTRDFTAGNYQAEIEEGYTRWFMEKSFPTSYHEDIQKYASEQDFQLHFILGIIRQESFFDPDARSYAGALGLMQIMPSTGKWIAQSLGEGRSFKTSKLKDPKTNLRYGAWYLDHLRDVVGDEPGMILAGHNGGPGNLSKWKGMFPVWESDKYLFYELIPSMQTRNFVRIVLTNQYVYEKLLEKDGVKVYF